MPAERASAGVAAVGRAAPASTQPRERSSKKIETATMAYSMWPTSDIQLSGMKPSMKGSPASDANSPSAITQVATPHSTPSSVGPRLRVIRARTQ